MPVRAKTLVKDKFWIVEENGQKLGTLQKQEHNGWIFLSKQDKRQVFHTQESLFTKFGFGIFDESNITKPEEEIQKDNLTIQCLMCRINCLCTPRLQKARANFVQDII